MILAILQNNNSKKHNKTTKRHKKNEYTNKNNYLIALYQKINSTIIE